LDSEFLAQSSEFIGQSHCSGARVPQGQVAMTYEASSSRVPVKPPPLEFL
jgi:hypothetical protein